MCSQCTLAGPASTYSSVTFVVKEVVLEPGAVQEIGGFIFAGSESSKAGEQLVLLPVAGLSNQSYTFTTGVAPTDFPGVKPTEDMQLGWR